jgi:hypothetical protein
MIENTTKRDPALHLLGAMSEGSDRYITGMEARGQRELVQSTDLPTESRWTADSEYEALGFTFGQPHAYDPLFRPATLPPGWKKVATDHAMHTDIVDEKGRRRASVFYKAAFYDRRASLSLVPPTAVLGPIEWRDEAPTSLPIDELLTRDLAARWIARELRETREHRDTYLKPSEDSYKRYTAKIARLELMWSLLPPASDA